LIPANTPPRNKKLQGPGHYHHLHKTPAKPKSTSFRLPKHNQACAQRDPSTQKIKIAKHPVPRRSARALTPSTIRANPQSMVMISEQREAYRQEDVLTINAIKPQPSAPRPLAKNLNLTALTQ
jgi:hypothetical protein